MPYTATVLSNLSLSPHVFLLKVTVVGDPAFAFKAGQFVIVPLPPEAGLNPQGKALKGFYSIASAEGSGSELELLIEHRPEGGPVSAWMSSRQPGDRFELQGPLGHFGLAETQDLGQVFLGFRAGIAPLRSLLLSSLALGGTRHHWLFLGAQGRAELIFDEQWRALQAAERRFHYIPVLQPTPENPYEGKNSDPADEFIKKVAQRNGLHIYVAGFSRDVDPMQAKLLAAGFGPAEISVEKFG